MKTLIFAALLISSNAFAHDIRVNGYMKSNGTYVQPYVRTAPDSNPYNNYSARGNVNPYNGNVGTVNPNVYVQPQSTIALPPLPSAGYDNE